MNLHAAVSMQCQGWMMDILPKCIDSSTLSQVGKAKTALLIHSNVFFFFHFYNVAFASIFTVIVMTKRNRLQILRKRCTILFLFIFFILLRPENRYEFIIGLCLIFFSSFVAMSLFYTIFILHIRWQIYDVIILYYLTVVTFNYPLLWKQN